MHTSTFDDELTDDEADSVQYSPMDTNHEASMWFSDGVVNEVMDEDDTAVGDDSAHLAPVNEEDADESDEDDASATTPAYSPISTSSGEADSDVEGGSIDTATKESDTEHHSEEHSEWFGFKIVGDNLDKTVRPRHQTLVSQTRSLHYFHSYAVRDRIDFSMFSEVAPQVDLKATDFESFLPTASDSAKLKDNFGVLIARILVKYIPAYTTFSDIIPQHIPHQYSSEMSRKSEVVSELTDKRNF